MLANANTKSLCDDDSTSIITITFEKQSMQINNNDININNTNNTNKINNKNINNIKNENDKQEIA